MADQLIEACALVGQEGARDEAPKVIHDRCVLEYNIENAEAAVQADRQAKAQEPLFRLIHGLPGSGKSQILKWLRSYFNEVWLWEEGIHYQFLAPLNSMADNIGGATLHSWSEIVWQDKKKEDKLKVTVRAKTTLLAWA